MIEAAILILIVLYVLGYVSIPGVSIPNIQIYTFNNHHITLYELLIIGVLFAVLSFAPRFLRIVIGAVSLIWVLSTIGIIAVKGLPALVIIALIFIMIFHRSIHYYRRYRRRYY